MSDGFLGRWSKRKLDVQQGKEVEAEPVVEVASAPPSQPQLFPEAGASEPTQPPPPTLEDVQALTADSDFKRFATADVPADVKNAAMKKLFADPRYNVMDGLDVYIDDFSKPDPIPEEWLGQLQQMARLGDYALTLEKEREAAKEAAKEATPGLIHDENQAVAEEPEVSESDAQTRQPPADSQQT
jgi:hypothetical protein